MVHMVHMSAHSRRFMSLKRQDEQPPGQGNTGSLGNTICFEKLIPPGYGGSGRAADSRHCWRIPKLTRERVRKRLHHNQRRRWDLPRVSRSPLRSRDGAASVGAPRCSNLSLRSSVPLEHASPPPDVCWRPGHRLRRKPRRAYPATGRHLTRVGRSGCAYGPAQAPPRTDGTLDRSWVQHPAERSTNQFWQNQDDQTPTYYRRNVKPQGPNHGPPLSYGGTRLDGRLCPACQTMGDHAVGGPHRGRPRPSARGAAQASGRFRPSPNGRQATYVAESLLAGTPGGLVQQFTIHQPRYPSLIIRTDASTTGMGGILLRPDGTPLRWAAPIDGAVADFLGVTVGESDFMTTFELLAFLTSLVVWESALQRHAVGIRPEMDNISALHITANLTSRDAAANHIAAEISLRLHAANTTIVHVKHWRNILNTEADALSRLQEGKSVPRRLHGLPRDSVPCHLDVFLMKDWPVSWLHWVLLPPACLACFPPPLPQPPTFAICRLKAMLLAITLLWGIDFPPELCYALLLDSVLTATLVCWCAHACRRPPGPPRPAPWAWPAALFAWPRDSVRRGQLGETESKVRRASTPRRRSPSQSTREPTQSTWAHPFATQGALRPAAEGPAQAPLPAHEWMKPGWQKPGSLQPNSWPGWPQPGNCLRPPNS